MTKVITTLSLLFLLSLGAYAQQYDLAIGLRSGQYSNITVKKTLSERTMTEGIISLRPRGFMATGLMEYQNPFAGRDAFCWYYGFGGHVGAWQGLQTGSSDVIGGAYSLGLDAIVGVEYNLKELPFNLSLDWKPAISLMSNSKTHSGGLRFSLRYTL